MIVTNALTKQFDDFLAVDEVSLKVDAGQVLALLGPNGAGKTTTVRMLTSVLRPTRGWATINGYDIVRDAPKVRASVGVLTEQHGLYERMPADEYLDFFGQIYQLDLVTRQARTRRLLEDFDLYQDRRRRIGEYSKGMRQKLALARALIHEPPVLLLDEPTSAMDPESARLVRDAIKELRSADRAIIICTHNLLEAEELADQIAIIRKGKIIVKGTQSALKSSLLGAAEYEMRMGGCFDIHQLVLPVGATLTQVGKDWLRYQTGDPLQMNQVMLRMALESGLPVVSLQEVTRSLEQVYLQAIVTSEDSGEGGAKKYEH